MKLVNIFTSNIIVENAATRECRKARNDFENKLSEDNNPKAFYKYVYTRRKVSAGISSLKRSDNTVTESDTDKAEELNCFFKDVFVLEDTENIPSFDDRSEGNNIENIIISENIVFKLMEKLNINKSFGPDLLHPRVLMELRHCIITSRAA